MFKELKRENLSKTLVRALSKYIIENNLKPGDRLPTESELASSFQVGRSVVREALKALEIIGLIVCRPGVGAVLSAEGVDPFLLPFVFGFVLEEKTLKSLCELRLIFEQGAAQLACINCDEEELKQLREIAEKLDAIKQETYDNPSDENQQKLCELEIQFHQNLVSSSKNSVLIKFSKLWEIFFSHALVSGDLVMASKAGHENVVEKIKHTEIVDAIINNEEDQATEQIKTHLAYWLKNHDGVNKNSLIKLAG
ncbi:GntR family transcriptional regulator [bacterium]|nr:GntR family transcriptional regulator [bacterium]